MAAGGPVEMEEVAEIGCPAPESTLVRKTHRNPLPRVEVSLGPGEVPSGQERQVVRWVGLPIPPGFPHLARTRLVVPVGVGVQTVFWVSPP